MKRKKIPLDLSLEVKRGRFEGCKLCSGKPRSLITCWWQRKGSTHWGSFGVKMRRCWEKRNQVKIATKPKMTNCPIRRWEDISAHRHSYWQHTLAKRTSSTRGETLLSVLVMLKTNWRIANGFGEGRDHCQWATLMLRSQGKVTYNTLLWWGPSSNPAHSESFSAVGYLFVLGAYVLYIVFVCVYMFVYLYTLLILYVLLVFVWMYMYIFIIGTKCIGGTMLCLILQWFNWIEPVEFYCILYFISNTKSCMQLIHWLHIVIF